MLKSPVAALLLLVAGGSEPARPVRPQASYSQVIIREQIVVRVPPRLRDAPDSEAAVRWKEHKGPKCVQARSVAGAALISQNSVDLILRDRSRVRARLNSSCPALDYYYGFYITPNPDGMICADRDIIRSRVGGECGIDKFKTLELKRAD